MSDDELIASVRDIMKRCDEHLFIGLGLDETEYRLACAAHDERNNEALEFILNHSGWRRLFEYDFSRTC